MKDKPSFLAGRRSSGPATANHVGRRSERGETEQGVGGRLGYDLKGSGVVGPTIAEEAVATGLTPRFRVNGDRMGAGQQSRGDIDRVDGQQTLVVVAVGSGLIPDKLLKGATIDAHIEGTASTHVTIAGEIAHVGTESKGREGAEIRIVEGRAETGVIADPVKLLGAAIDAGEYKITEPTNGCLRGGMTESESADRREEKFFHERNAFG